MYGTPASLQTMPEIRVLNGRDVTHKDPKRLEGWANRILTKYKAKREVLSLWTEHPLHQC